MDVNMCKENWEVSCQKTLLKNPQLSLDTVSQLLIYCHVFDSVMISKLSALHCLAKRLTYRRSNEVLSICVVQF